MELLHKIVRKLSNLGPIRITPSNFLLGAGETEQVQIDVSIPKNVSYGLL